MKFGYKDRLVLLSVLPPEGNILDLRVLKDLRDGLAFSEAERAHITPSVDGTAVVWDDKIEQPKDIEVGPRAYIIIQNQLRKLNDTNKLTLDHLNLYDKFITEGK